jgi:hypothetical protein
VLEIKVTDRAWYISGDSRQYGACTSRLDGRRAALDAIEQTLKTALMQVRDWRGAL